MSDPLGSMLDLFAKSPFKPLNEHAEKVKQTVLKMDEAVHAYVEGDRSRVEELYKQISALEHEADIIKHDIREHLPSSLMMPVDRTDILKFLKQQDDVANSAEMVAQLLDMKIVPMPAAVKDVLLKLEKEVLETVEKHVEVAGKITTLLDSAFAGRHVREMQATIDLVDSQKHNVDVTRLEAMRTIYGHEKELGPVGVYHLIELVQEMGWVAAHAEKAAGQLRLIVAKR